MRGLDLPAAKHRFTTIMNIISSNMIPSPAAIINVEYAHAENRYCGLF